MLPWYTQYAELGGVLQEGVLRGLRMSKGIMATRGMSWWIFLPLLLCSCRGAAPIDDDDDDDDRYVYGQEVRHEYKQG